ncbi:MAG: hypothetical protein AB7C91_04655 [Sphaerochaeta sp.]|uniref:hypothetical protein n=1 Tax=Sphaerochaeta sp. TaxID=1972642 RepID=UPI002FCC1F4C
MRKLLILSLMLCLWFPLFAEDAPKFPKATVYLVGVIEPKDLEISIYNEEGDQLTAEDAQLVFDFPNLEEWEVTKSLYFKYSAHLTKQTVGKLIFEVADLSLDDANTLRTSLELASENLLTRVENGNTFNTTFLAGNQENVAMGKLTVRVQKRADDVYTAGTYAGSFTINYTEGS